MDIFSLFILSTAIGIGASRGPSSEYNSAAKALAKATYIQTGTNKQIKRLENRYIPVIVKKHGVWVTGTAKLLTEKKISFEWTF